MARNEFLTRNWDSEYRPLRDLLAVLLTTVLALSPPYYLLVGVLSRNGVAEWGGALGNNMGLLTVTFLWTLLVFALFGDAVGSAYRTYQRR